MASVPAKPDWRGNCPKEFLTAIGTTKEAVPEGPRERSDRSADAVLGGVPAWGGWVGLPGRQAKGDMLFGQNLGRRTGYPTEK
jgi:hypothetical protein